MGILADMKNLSIAYILLNLLDLAFSLYAFKLGATEANPMLQGETSVFVTKKLAMVVLGVLVANLAVRVDDRYTQKIKKIMWFGCALYAAVNTYHIVNLINLH